MAAGVVAQPEVGTTMLVDRIVAIVNGEIITYSEFSEYLLPLSHELRSTVSAAEYPERLKALQQTVLDALIDEKLMVQEAMEIGIVIDDEEILAAMQEIRDRAGIKTDEEFEAELLQQDTTLPEFREHIRNQLRIQRVRTYQVRRQVNVDEIAVKRYYEKNLDKYRVAAGSDISLFLIAVSEDATADVKRERRRRAEEILNQLKGGADFTDITARYSDGPAADKGGVMSTLRKGTGLPEIEQYAFSLAPGEISPVFESRFGFNIIKVRAREDERVTPLSEVRDAIQQELYTKELDKKYMAWMQDLRSKAYIDKKL